MTELSNVTVTAESNVYFDGRCISHSLVTADGAKKSVGVILASSLTFGTAAPERMEIVRGSCRVRFAGSEEWQEFAAGSAFEVGADSSFDIEVADQVDYICHYG